MCELIKIYKFFEELWWLMNYLFIRFILSVLNDFFKKIYKLFLSIENFCLNFKM